MNVNAPSDTFMTLPGRKRKTHPATLNGPASTSTAPAAGGKRLPLLGFLPNRPRNHFIAMLGEFAGTFLFLFFAFSATQVANAAASGGQTEEDSLSQVPNASVLLYISLAFGFSLAVNAWIFFRISGGEFQFPVFCRIGSCGAVLKRVWLG